jgi:hypothetical protein
VKFVTTVAICNFSEIGMKNSILGSNRVSGDLILATLVPMVSNNLGVCGLSLVVL